MPKPIVNGQLGPIKAPVEYEYDPTRGQQVIERWESAGDGLHGIAAQYRTLGIAYNFVASPHKSTITARTGGSSVIEEPEITTDTWQILANELQKEIWELPRLAAVNKDVIARARNGVENKTASASISPALTGDALTAYELAIRGTTHYAFGQYVLRHTTNVSSRYGVNIADTNVECIYTAAQLIAECTNANLWVRPLPGRLAYKIQSLPAPTAKAGYLWGWRKLPSTETTTAGNRVEISTEYWLEQWSTFIYSTASL